MDFETSLVVQRTRDEIVKTLITFAHLLLNELFILLPFTTQSIRTIENTARSTKNRLIIALRKTNIYCIKSL